MSDQFLTIGEPGLAETRVQGSRFFGRAIHLEIEDAAVTALEAERARFFDATHWCWALRLSAGSEVTERASDAGEPHGTAGLPILRQIQSVGILNCMVIVSRYFGGTRLGTGGLVRAYGDCANQALAAATKILQTRYQQLRVTCPFDDLSILYHQSKRFDAIVEPVKESDGTEYLIACRDSKAEELTTDLIDRSGNRILIQREATWIR